MHGDVIIPNPSVMTLTIGDMIQDLFAGGKAIGNTTMKNVVLRPGDNRIPVTSITDQAAVIPLIGPNHQFADGVLDIEAKSRDVISPKGEVLQYFTEAMKANPVHFKLDIAEPLRKLGLGAIVDGPGAAKSGSGSTTGSSSSAAAAST